jgi:DNA polymerase/3'-5' exonuclease PolX
VMLGAMADYKEGRNEEFQRYDAYRKAAALIRGLSFEVTNGLILAKDGTTKNPNPQRVPGIGDSTSKAIQAFLDRGKDWGLTKKFLQDEVLQARLKAEEEAAKEAAKAAKAAAKGAKAATGKKKNG